MQWITEDKPTSVKHQHTLSGELIPCPETKMERKRANHGASGQLKSNPDILKVEHES
jgi:hypothetical protein